MTRRNESGSTEQVEYEGFPPATGGISELDENRLLITGEGPSGYISEDAGRTWDAPFPYLQGGKPLEGGPMKRGIIRLDTGDLGMVYVKKEEVAKSADYDTRGFYFATSGDDGKNWSDGVPLDMPREHDLEKGIFHVMWGNLTQLSTGRLIAPAYWGFGGRYPEVVPATEKPVTGTIGGRLVKRVADGHTYEAAMGGCFVYYSDDPGRSWSRCTGSVMVWPLPGEDNQGGFGASFEPVVIELKDGRVMMFVRTTVGRIFQSFSEDGGAHWHLPEPTELASGDVPCFLGRLRTTGDLLVIWNQGSVEEIEKGYSRGRLSTAVSRDEGKSWGNFRTVELSGGMEDVDRVALPPVKHVRAQPDLGVLPDDYSRYDYPQLAFVQGKVVMKYGWSRYVDGERERQHKLKVVPEEWFYG